MSFLFVMIAFMIGPNGWAQSLDLVSLDSATIVTPGSKAHAKAPVKAEAKPFKKECSNKVADLKRWADEDYPANMSLLGSEFEASKMTSVRMMITAKGRLTHISIYSSHSILGQHLPDFALLDGIAYMCRIAPKRYTAELAMNSFESGMAKEQMASAIAEMNGISIEQVESQKYFTIPIEMKDNGELALNLPGFGAMIPQSQSRGAR